MWSTDEALQRLFQVTTVMADAMAEDLVTRGLTQARATLLACLHRRGPSNQRALADELRVTPRNVTGLVDGLEESGLVVRSRHPDDRRATLVSLTDAGARAADALARDERALAQFLFAGHDRSDLDALVENLDRLLARLAGPDFEQLRHDAIARWPAQR